MGRSRGGFQNPDEDLTQKSRRRKHASNGDNADPTTTGERKKALYHCNYCNKDITGKIRIKCGVCSDFDLCIECFSVGAEVTPHKCNHPYRVMDNLSFPLISPDWNADDEMLLLEGIEMYGLWNWKEVCEHVGTKNKDQCILHYSSVYLNSPVFPRPDMSHVAGKNKKELLEMARCQSEEKKAAASEKEKEEQSFSPTRVKCGGGGGGSDPLIPSRSSREARVSETKKPTCSAAETNGYNSKRGEFDTEFDNDAERLLAEMEFKANETEEERELKLRVVRIYSKKLEERKKRKDFILQRNVLGANPAEAGVSPEEKEMCRRYDVFMRFQSKEEHEELLQSMIAEHRLGRRLQELKEARTAGCQSSDEAEKYLGRRRKREPEDREKETATTVMKSSVTSAAPEPSVSMDNNNHDAPVVDADLLSEPEKRMCTDMRVLPTHYLRMQEVLTIEIFSGKVSKKSDAHCLFKLEPGKVDRVYDALVSKGIAPP